MEYNEIGEEKAVAAGEGFTISLALEDERVLEVPISDPSKSLRDLIEIITDKFHLPRTNDGGPPAIYALAIDREGELEILDYEDKNGRDLTLIDYDIASGDTLHLIAMPIAGGIERLVMTHSPKKSSFWKRLFHRQSHQVYSSLFAPDQVSKGQGMMVQVYVYKDGERGVVCGEATRSDPKAQEKSYAPLNFCLDKGDEVQITLRASGAEIERPTKSFIWQGCYTRVSFYVHVPTDCTLEQLWGEAFLVVNGAALGELDFVTSVVDFHLTEKATAQVKCHRYSKIFISYAHKDYERVKFIARAYQAQGVEYFFDRDYLKAGDVYPQVIRDYIDSADLFILCWSQHAAESEYVDKERHQALQRAYPNVKTFDSSQLAIYPISIEPRAQLPEDMKEIYNFEMI